jgi:hypothetical protein
MNNDKVPPGALVINLVRPEGVSEKEWEERILKPREGRRVIVNVVNRMLREPGESEDDFQEHITQYQKAHPYHKIILE